MEKECITWVPHIDCYCSTRSGCKKFSILDGRRDSFARHGIKKNLVIGMRTLHWYVFYGQVRLWFPHQSWIFWWQHVLMGCSLARWDGLLPQLNRWRVLACRVGVQIVRVEVVVTSWVMRAVRFLAAQFPKIHISSYMVCGQSSAQPLTNLLVSPCRVYLVHAYLYTLWAALYLWRKYLQEEVLVKFT